MHFFYNLGAKTTSNKSLSIQRQGHIMVKEQQINLITSLLPGVKVGLKLQGLEIARETVLNVCLLVPGASAFTS